MKKFFKRFKYALQGLKLVAVHEMSFRIQLVGALVVIVIIILLPLATWEQILLILMTAAVLVLEIMNSIFERLSDALKPRMSPIVRDIKDMMAGAVLLTAITAIVVAVMILWSYIQELF
ncbi:diacylglycerol kinase [Patescibacteria group bacterium]|nr:diacylglycerol kinase [Patescibacteria group bacterium]